MAADTPLNQLTLTATSVADDLGYVALADIASALKTAADGRIDQMLNHVFGTPGSGQTPGGSASGPTSSSASTAPVHSGAAASSPLQAAPTSAVISTN